MKLFHNKKIQKTVGIGIFISISFGFLVLPINNANAGIGVTYPNAATCQDNCPIFSGGKCDPVEGGIDGLGGPFICTEDTSATGAVREFVNDLPGSIVKLSVAPFVNSVAALLLTLSNLFLGLSGLALNIAIEKTVIGMSSFLGGFEILNTAWTLVRDVVNMIFIFIVLLIAISIILRTKVAGIDGKKMLTSIIIAALLINFSMFFTRIIIDASNVLTTKLYEPVAAISGTGTIPGTEINEEGEGGATVNSGQVSGLSGAFMAATVLSTVYDQAGILANFDINFALFQFAGAIFILVAAFVFGAAAILFVIRFVVLILLMITSPVAFLGMILPKGSEISGRWWKTLIDQALWAPVFMLLVTVSFIIFSDEKFATVFRPEGAGFAKAFTGAGDSVIIIINFAIVIGFLIAALMIAKSLAKSGAGKTVDWATGVAGKATFGLAAFGARESVGRAGRAVAESKYLKDVASKGGARGLIAQGLLAGGDYTQKRSLDLRGALPDIGAGKPAQGGFEKTFKDRVKRYEAYDKGAAEYAASQVAIARKEALNEYNKAENDLEQARKQEREATGFAKPQRTADRIAMENKLSEAQKKLTETAVNQTQAEQELAEATRRLSRNTLVELSEALQTSTDNKASPESRAAAQERLNSMTAREQEYVDATRTLDRLLEAQGKRKKAAAQIIGASGLGSSLPERREAARKTRKGQDSKGKILEELKKEMAKESEAGSGGENKASDEEPGEDKKAA